MSVTGTAMRSGAPQTRAENLPARVLNLVLTLLVLLALAELARGLMPVLNRPVTGIQVAGTLTHLTPAQIAAAAAIAPGTRFFDLNMSALRRRVEALPWVSQAAITREWPDRVRIRVVERRPYARWNGDALLDTGGTAFDAPLSDLPKVRLAQMPRLAGPAGREQDVMDAWKTLSTALAGGPFALAGLQLNARGDWIAHCRSGVILRLGRGDPASKLPLLERTIPAALASRLNQVAAIDLRYTNGFAVRWAGTAGQSDAPRAAASGRENRKS